MPRDGSRGQLMGKLPSASTSERQLAAHQSCAVAFHRAPLRRNCQPEFYLMRFPESMGAFVAFFYVRGDLRQVIAPDE